MNEKEMKKYETIEKIVNGELTRKEAEEILNLSKRQVNRLIIKYKEEGKDGFIHKGRGKENNNKTNSNLKKAIIELYLNEYDDYNFSHFYERIIVGKYDISFQNMINILSNEDIISPLAQHKTVNEYNKKMRELTKANEITEEKAILYETRQIQQYEAHTRKSNLFMKFGEELQMDASEYMWFGGIVTYLHLVVDKATKIVLFGWFDYQETMRAYFVLLFNVVYLYGIPKAIRTDKRKGLYSENGEKTHFGRICEELKIELHSSSNPRFKPNVERENHTFKNRLKAELRHENITTIEEANKYLNEVFIPYMNSRFAYSVEKTLMKPNPYSKENLSLIISERYERVIDSGSCIQYKSKYYIPTTIEGKEVYYKQKTPAVVIIDYNNELWCLIEQEYYKLKEIQMQEKKEYNPAMAAAELEEKMNKERKKYIPPVGHPYKSHYPKKL